ncbi:MAG: universal stress protein [Pseudomonadota bacterium]
MYQRILVPLDGSTTSMCALREALKFAKEQGARIRLLQVVEDVRFIDTEGFIDYSSLQEAAKRSGQRVLAQAEEAARQSGIGVEVDLLEAGGERAENVILAESKRWMADLIVVGTHGRSGFSRLLFGSVAEGVARGATMPVLLVRSE